MYLKDVVAIALVLVLGIVFLGIFFEQPMFDEDDERPDDAKPDYDAVREEAEHPSDRGDDGTARSAYDDEGALYNTARKGEFDER